MRSKYIAGILALVLGVFGIHRFYLSQYIKGSLYILLPPVVALLFFYFTNSLEVIKHTSTDITSGNINLFDTWFIFFYIPVLLIAVIDAVIFFLMPQEKFDQKYNIVGRSVLKETVKSLLFFAISSLVVIFLYNAYFVENKVNVADAEAQFELSSTELATAFAADEQHAFEKYGEQVISVQGEVVNEEIFIGTGARSLILNGEEDYLIKINFTEDEWEQVNEVKIGNFIKVKGFVFEVLNNEVVVNNARLADVSPGAKPANVE